MIGVGGIMESQQSVSEGVVTTWEWACCGDGRTRVQLGGEFATDAPEELCGGGGGAQEEERPRRRRGPGGAPSFNGCGMCFVPVGTMNSEIREQAAPTIGRCRHGLLMAWSRPGAEC